MKKYEKNTKNAKMQKTGIFGRDVSPLTPLQKPTFWPFLQKEKTRILVIFGTFRHLPKIGKKGSKMSFFCNFLKIIEIL